MDKLKHQKLFETQVEVLASKSGAAKKKYKCRKCACVKPTRITAIQHVSTCGKTFHGKRRGKNGKSKFTCNQCPFQAGTLAQLALHRRRAHLGALTRPAYRCTTCRKGFKMAKYLKEHLKLHRVAPAFTCTTCSASFSKRYSLKRHNERTHLGEHIVQHGEAVLVQGGADVGDRGVLGTGSGIVGDPRVEKSRWSKYMPDPSTEDDDEEEGEEGGEEDGEEGGEEVAEEGGLSMAEQYRNERLSALSDSLAQFGRSHGESEEEIARMQNKIRERMIVARPRLHLPSSSNRVGLQLTPGVQYVISIPLPIPQPTVTLPSPAPSQQSQSLPSAKSFVCGTCGHAFRDNFNLRTHVDKMHTVADGGLKCERYRALLFFFLLLYQFSRNKFGDNLNPALVPYYIKYDLLLSNMTSTTKNSAHCPISNSILVKVQLHNPFLHFK